MANPSPGCPASTPRTSISSTIRTAITACVDRAETPDRRHQSAILIPQRRVSEIRKGGVWLTPKNLADHGDVIQFVLVKTKSPSPGLGRGRPVGPAKKRINARFPESLAERIEYAAALRGVAVASFIQEAVAARAEEVIEAESLWQLTRDQVATVAAMIARPPKASKKMLKAAKQASRHVVIRD